MARSETSHPGSSTRPPARDHIVVIGQAARDLALRVDRLPEAEDSAVVSERIERLGGKGANVAVGLRQLNPAARVTLVAVLGTDASGDHAFADAVDSGLDTTHMVRRGRTALLVDLVERDGHRRLLEDVPSDSQLAPADVHAAAGAIRTADTVVLQLQQPADALLAAIRSARDAGARVVLDGAIEGRARDELLAGASVVRADARETLLLGSRRRVAGRRAARSRPPARVGSGCRCGVRARRG